MAPLVKMVSTRWGVCGGGCFDAPRAIRRILNYISCTEFVSNIPVFLIRIDAKSLVSLKKGGVKTIEINYQSCGTLNILGENGIDSF